MPATIAPPAETGSHLAGVELSMDDLATASVEELAAGLGPLAAGYAVWLDEQEARIAELPAALRETAETAIFTARQCAGRIRAGIELLTSPSAPGHELALEAFRFANQAMALQRRHTTIAAIRESEGLSYAEALAAVQAQGAHVASWRPFQLAFVLLTPGQASITRSARSLPSSRSASPLSCSPTRRGGPATTPPPPSPRSALRPASAS